MKSFLLNPGPDALELEVLKIVRSLVQAINFSCFFFTLQKHLQL